MENSWTLKERKGAGEKPEKKQEVDHKAKACMGWATLLEAWHLLKYQLWQTLTISLQVDLGSARLGVERQGLLSPLNWALRVDRRDRTADAAGGARAQP